MTYIALHAEKWLWGSSRKELEHDERACWTDILARAGITNVDEPGKIHFVSDEHLAEQLQVPLELLQRTLEKCKKSKKIKIIGKKSENIFVLSVIKWEKYQHIWMHQKSYRTREKAKREKQKKAYLAGTKKHNADITGYVALADRIGGDRIGTDIRKDDRIGEDTNTDPSNPRNIFLSMLQDLSNSLPYPFSEVEDRQIYDAFAHKIDVLAQLEKKIKFWTENPLALKSKKKAPRQQLVEWFLDEVEFQKGKVEGEN
jgi:hypothetical protein